MQGDQEPKNKEIELYAIQNKKQVGTQVFDQNMPSDLNFEENIKPKDLEITDVKPRFFQSQAKPIKTEFMKMKQYTIKGKATVKSEIQYSPGSLIKQTIPTYQVKAYSQENSSGILKNIWQRVVGYTNRQFYINDGYLYLLQDTKEGLFVHYAWPFEQIFKIFPDSQQNMIRFVVKSGQILIPKDFQVQSVSVIIQKILEEANKVGIKIQ